MRRPSTVTLPLTPAGMQIGTHEIRIPSQVERTVDLHRYLTSWRREQEIPDALADRVELAMNEAVVNAIRHGNREEASKTVRISMRWGGGSVWCRVEDQGEGFDPADLPDPLDQEHLLLTHGRGVFLIGQTADRHRYLEGGRVLEMEFDA